MNWLLLDKTNSRRYPLGSVLSIQFVFLFPCPLEPGNDPNPVGLLHLVKEKINAHLTSLGFGRSLRHGMLTFTLSDNSWRINEVRKVLATIMKDNGYTLKKSEVIEAIPPANGRTVSCKHYKERFRQGNGCLVEVQYNERDDDFSIMSADNCWFCWFDFNDDG